MRARIVGLLLWVLMAGGASAQGSVDRLFPDVSPGGQSLLLEASDNGKTGAVPFSGSVDWSRGTDENGLPTLIGRASIPARNLVVEVQVSKNSDPGLPASHLMEITFRIKDSFIGGSIAGLPGVLLKNEELVQGIPLVGASARVEGNSFLFALSASPEDITANERLLMSRKYMDLALIYGTGKRAIITLEKDAAAVALFSEVIGDWSSPIPADKRIALVIGNSQYMNVPRLYNVGSDATDVSAALERIGFKVTQVRNADYGQMRSALQKFGADADGADIALIYYAGHGIEVENKNYLVPVDARLESDRDVDFETISLALVEGAVSGAKTLRMVVLDACRNNPFAVEMALSSPTRSIGRGLSAVEPARGVLIAYSAKGGSLAKDVGDGRNSPFASAFIEYLDDPGLDVGFMFRKISDAVMRSTDNQQEPFVYGRLPGDPVYLVAPVPAS
jgi:hypothetical protein